MIGPLDDFVLVVVLMTARQFLGHQRFAIGLRDLIVVGMDFAESQEAVTVPAIFHEGGLQGRFDPCDLREIDVSFQLLLVFGFEIEFFDAITADDDDARLFRMGRVDQHFVGHGYSPRPGRYDRLGF